MIFMKYIAKINIGDYKMGDEVPKEIAEVWMKMYNVSPVEAVEGGEPVKKKEINMDLNGDGVFDRKDKSIAAKILATKTTKKKSRRKRR